MQCIFETLNQLEEHLADNRYRASITKVHAFHDL